MTAVSNTESNDQILKIGLLVDSETVPQYLLELVQWCQEQSSLSISHLLIMDITLKKRRSALDILRSSCFFAITWLETQLLKKAGLPKTNASYLKVDLITERIYLKTTTDKSGNLTISHGIELDSVKALKLDLLLMAGAGTLQGCILTTAKYGVISPCYSGENKAHGEPVGFWEVFLKLNYSGFAIHELSDGIRPSNELLSGRIRTQYYYLLNNLHIRQKYLHYMKELLASIARDKKLPPYATPILPKISMRGVPSLSVQAKYVITLGLRLIARVARRMLKMDYKWNVAFKKNDWGTLAMETAVKIPNPENHFLADPFVVNESGKNFCFLEDYDYSTRKGHIAAYQLHDDHAECLGNALIEPYHLSFPYMFRYMSELYMCPETSRNRQIRVYKCVNFPLQWQLHTVLMDDVSAADTMLFERDGRWWMLTNMDVANTGDFCTELSIYWADSPLSNKWTAHKMNPVFIDAAKGRNAGLLYDATNIYRVSQKQGFDFYGQAFSINRIDQLDETTYRETEIRTVQADFFASLKGTHHLHSSGGITVFDFLSLQKI